MVRAKKYLGQHFLKDENIAQKIVSMLSKEGYNRVLEIGAGTGALTKYLLRNKTIELFIVEVDRESVEFLKKNFPQLRDRIFEQDFLKLDLSALAGREEKLAIIGNFPYNISSQILFMVYEQRDHVPEVVGMFQKEVAERIASPPSSRSYGILSVLLQAFYDIEYLFTVDENVFTPPPKVKSAVIRLRRNGVNELDCNEHLFKTVVKAAFNQRRKTLKNALGNLLQGMGIKAVNNEMLKKRAEQLTVNDFVTLTKWIESSQKPANADIIHFSANP